MSHRALDHLGSLPWLLAAALTLLGSPSAQAPVLTERARLQASDSAPGDQFGTSLSVDGEWLAVGAALASCGYGCGVQGLEEAYVFERDGSGWNESSRLDAVDTLDATPGDGFGAAVALDGDTLVVGAPFHGGSGAAYVFVRSGRDWIEQAKLEPAVVPGFQLFGLSASLDGETAVIGAWGGAFVFVRNGTTWAQEAELVQEGSFHAAFGYSVSLSGNTAIVGAPDLYNCGHFGCDEPGAACVYMRDGARWTQRSELFLPRGNDDPTNQNRFGFSVALDGDALLIGAPGSDRFLGAAYAYSRQGASWVQEARLAMTTSSGDVGFGHSVSLSGDVALVGTNGWADGALVFVRDGSTWSERARLAASSGGVGEGFGTAVAIDHCTAVVGASEGPGGGSAYAYEVLPGSARFRNAGANPASFTATTPVLGDTWTATVDLAASGHGAAVLVGFTAPAAIPLSGGQVLLCRPAGGHELLGRPAAAGPSATFRIAIPDDLALCGISLSTQAVLLGIGVPFALSNAQDLVLGTL